MRRTTLTWASWRRLSASTLPTTGTRLTACSTNPSGCCSSSSGAPRGSDYDVVAAPSSSSFSFFTVTHQDGKRAFYSGQDPDRVRRLRRSGITFNKPRGRDTLSLAFESRIRVLPLLSLDDLYAPPDPSLLHAFFAGREDDPTSAAGSHVSRKKALAGDARMAQVQRQQQAAEAALRRRRRWRVLVVQPVRAAEVEAPVLRPHPHRMYYHETTATNNKNADFLHHAVLEKRLVDINDPQSWRGELTAEEREELLEAEAEAAASAPTALLAGGEDADTLAAASTTTTTRTREGEAVEPHPPSSSSLTHTNSNSSKDERELLFYHTRYRKQLRTNGDTAQLLSSFVQHKTIHFPELNAKHQKDKKKGDPPESKIEMDLEYHMALCVDPFVDHERFRREEAQVEMISAFRNILYEAAELQCLPSPDTHRDGGPPSSEPRHQEAKYRPRHHTEVADVLRIPALSLYSAGPRFFEDLGKLNQQSLIKGFHRIANEAKERLITNRAFSVELYVPLAFFPMFEKAFLEEAWETPTSVLSPGRVALYPGLAPPQGLLQYEGWVGKRPELEEAVRTRGRSLTAPDAPPPRTLDGRRIEAQDVFAHLRLFGAEKELQLRLEGERASAAAAAPSDSTTAPTNATESDGKTGTGSAPRYAPLRAGLQGAQTDATSPPSPPSTSATTDST